MWFKQSISGWIAKEIHRTEMALLQAEDELANAQLRVKALRSRSARLQGKQDKVESPIEKALRLHPLTSFDEAAPAKKYWEVPEALAFLRRTGGTTR